jgi:hypothetical protein
MKLFRRPRHRRLRLLSHLRRPYQHHLRAPKHRRRPHRHPAPAKAQARVLPPDRKGRVVSEGSSLCVHGVPNRQRLEPSLTLNPFRTQPTLLCYFVGNAQQPGAASQAKAEAFAYTQSVQDTAYTTLLLCWQRPAARSCEQLPSSEKIQNGSSHYFVVRMVRL